MNISSENLFILGSVKIDSSQKDIDQLNDLLPMIKDWDYFTEISIGKGIAPLIYKKLSLLDNQGLIPDIVKEKIHEAYYKTLIRSVVLHDTFKKVGEALLSNDIQIIVLKGIFLSEWLYKDLALRQFTDIDLLVKPQDGEKCIEILKAMGFKPFDEGVSDFINAHSEIVHYQPMVLNKVIVEIHVKLHPGNKNYNLITSDFIEKSIPVTIDGLSVYAFRLNDLIIYLCVHLDKHFRGADLQFTSINDIVNLLSSYGESINWSEFINSCRINKCEDLVFSYLILIDNFFDINLPAEIVEEYNHLLSDKDEKLFIKHLHGNCDKVYHISTHWHNINNTVRFANKVKYIVDLIFPPKKFMIQKYGLVSSRKSFVGSEQSVVGSRQSVVGSKQSVVGSRQESKQNQDYKLQTTNYKLMFWWLWYPYRWWEGVKGLWRVISDK